MTLSESSSKRASRFAIVFAAVAILISAYRIFWVGEPADQGPSKVGSDSAAAEGRELPGEDRIHDVLAVLTSGFREETVPIEEGPPDGLLLQVVEKGSNRRLAGAEVVFLDPASLDRATREEAFLSGVFDFGSLVTRYGRRYRANRAGELRLPRFRDRAGVLSRAGELSSVMEIRSTAKDPIRLELEPRAGPLVQVQDDAGRPVDGVPVALRSRGGDRATDLWRGVSRAIDGLVILPSLGPLLEESRMPESELWASLAIPLAEPVEASLDARGGDDPIRLQIPATGRILVTVLDFEGRAVKAGALVALDVAMPGVDGGVFFGALSHQTVAVQDGKALFPFVGLGLTLRVEAYGGDRFRPVACIVPGPATVGETKSIEIQFLSRYPAIEGRAVDETGTVLRAATLQATLRTTEAESSVITGAPLRTDEEGHFRFVVKGSIEVGAPYELELALQPVVAGEPRRVGTVRRPSGTLQGDVDVGSVVLRPLPLLLSGHVRDALGNPLRGVHILASVEREHRPAEPPPILEWRAESDADGCFAIFAHAFPSGLTVLANRQDYLPQKRQGVRTGTHDLGFVLRQGLRFRGRVEVDAAVHPTDLEVVIGESEDGNLSDELVRLDAHFGFESPPLVPGTYEVAIRLRDAASPLQRIRYELVAAGEPDSKPPLEFDLRSKLRVIQVEAQDEEGLALPSFRVRRSDPVGQSILPWSRSRDSEARLVTDREDVDLIVTAPGYGPEALRDVGDHVKVTLRPGVAARVQLPPGLSIPNPPLILRATLLPVDPDQPLAEPEAADFLQDGTASFVVGAEGRYRLMLSLVRRGAFPEAVVGVNSGASPVLEIRRTASPLLHQVALTRLQVEEAERKF